MAYISPQKNKWWPARIKCLSFSIFWCCLNLCHNEGKNFHHTVLLVGTGALHAQQKYKNREKLIYIYIYIKKTNKQTCHLCTWLSLIQRLNDQVYAPFRYIKHYNILILEREVFMVIHRYIYIIYKLHCLEK